MAERLLAIHADLPGAKTIPQGLTRFASAETAPNPAESETSFVTEYLLAAGGGGADVAGGGGADAVGGGALELSVLPP